MLFRHRFSYAGKAQWIRQTAADFKHVFYLYPFRPGADYYPHGALSFDFVPRIEAGKVKIRREPKHVRMHVGVKHYGLDPAFSISRDRAQARDRCVEIATKTVPVVNEMLESIRTIADAMCVFETRKASDREMFYCYPEMALAYAYVLAKVGRAKDAKAELDKLLTIQPSYFPSNIRDAFEAALSSN
jgi:hypothetical protein